VYYKVSAVDRSGNESPPASPVTVTGAQDHRHGPSRDALLGNVPNPFSSGTEIAFDLARESRVRIAVYDVRGRLVRELLEGTRPSGRYRIHWDGRDGRGRSVASGVYLCRMETPGFRAVRKMVVMR